MLLIASFSLLEPGPIIGPEVPGNSFVSTLVCIKVCPFCGVLSSPDVLGLNGCVGF